MGAEDQLIGFFMTVIFLFADIACGYFICYSIINGSIGGLLFAGILFVIVTFLLVFACIPMLTGDVEAF